MVMSSSPDRNTFQRDSYISRCEADGREPNPAYVDMFDKILEDNRQRRLEVRENDLEYDLRTIEWILDRVRASDTYAQNLYAALCNNDFIRSDMIEMLKDTRWSCSWRFAGGIIADMRESGDYIDWYCSGIGEGLGNGDIDGTKGYVAESVVTDEIRRDLERLGWLVIEEREQT
jgi:hypothetical protein